VKGRRYVFDVQVTNEDGVTIGEGTHERALINISRFAAQLA
jgi:predicted thioesterase